MNLMLSGFADEISPVTAEQFAHLKELGMSYFEPRGINGKNIADLSDEEVTALKKQMREYKISASSIGSPIGKIDIGDDFDAHLAKLRRVIRTAKMLDTQFIRVFSFFMPANEKDLHRDEALFRMNAMAEEAKREGVVLLHENEKDIYGETARRCRDIFESVGSEHLRAVFDMANFVQCGQTVFPDAYYEIEEYIEYVHIKDAQKDGAVVPAGQGDGCVREIIRALSDRGYCGFLSLEPHLGSFEGLAALEKDDKMTKLSKSDAGKFTMAFEALMKIIKEVEQNG
ncbi:MAG: sugar phosphate isomerase/epimerase family protein [Clostridia bacterium]|nr:sugar phosphate isomerase/epimerase family protein [Clostridia bacterium]